MVELSNLDNEVLVKLVSGDLVETVVAHDVIGRLMIQCARQPGLAQVRFSVLYSGSIFSYYYQLTFILEDLSYYYFSLTPLGMRVPTHTHVTFN